jgi:integrase
LSTKAGDPAAAKAKARDTWSVKQASDAYLASAEYRQKTAKVRQGESSTLRRHVVYRLEHTPLPQLDVPLVRQLLREIEKDTRINARKRRLGGPGAARKAVRILSMLLSWCVSEGRLARNPLIGGLRLDGDNERDVVISETAEYAALFSAMDELVADGEMRAASRVFLAVAALTGMRRGELQGLRWGNVDLGNRRIALRDSKGIRLARRRGKAKPPEVVSLPPFAAAVLAAHRPEGVVDDDPVFVPRRGEVYEINRDWLKVRAKAGLPPGLALHGLRHSVGTVGVLTGLSGPEVQKLLRHANITTTAKYIHLASRLRLQDRAMAAVEPPLRESKRTA